MWSDGTHKLSGRRASAAPAKEEIMLQMLNRLSARPLLLMTALALFVIGCGLGGPAPLLPTPIDALEELPTLTPMPPTSTPVVPTTTVLEDGLNDGLTCVTGQPLSETPPGVDIARAVVDILPAGSAGEPERFQFTIQARSGPGA
jgi:hypothetical protein